MDEKIRRLAEWSKGRKALPYSIELSPTLRCNLNCLFCWRYEKKVDFGNELKLKDYERILEDSKQLKVREIRIIGGGEPLLRRDTFEIMKKVKKYGMFGYICTNGTLFSDEIIRALVEIDWDHVKISLHSPDENTEDFLAQSKSYKKTVENIKKFAKWKKKLGRSKPKIEIGFVLNRINFRKVSKMVKLAKKLDVQSFFVEPITVYTKKGEDLKLKEEEMVEFEEIARKAYSSAKGLETNLRQFFSHELIKSTGKMNEEIRKFAKSKRKNFLSIPCFEPWWRMGIRADGMICPCGFFDQETTENANEKSLKEIWFGEYFERRRKELIQGNIQDYCQKCCTSLVQHNQAIREQLSKFIA